MLVGYKLESTESGEGNEKRLVEKAKKLMNDSDCDLVVANELADVKLDCSSVHILKKGKKRLKKFVGSKVELAEEIFALLETS